MSKIERSTISSNLKIRYSDVYKGHDYQTWGRISKTQCLRVALDRQNTSNKSTKYTDEAPKQSEFFAIIVPMTLAKKIYFYLLSSFLLSSCNAQSDSQFQIFSSIYEPSGVVQLADGHILVVEDEKEHPFSLLQLDENNRLSPLPLSNIAQTSKGVEPIKLDALEAVTLGSDNWIYAITSHSTTSSGKQKKRREKLVRFHVSEGELVNYQSLPSLRKLLASTLPNESMKHLNIEGLAYNHDTHSLLLGLRRPLDRGKAIIVQLENVDKAFKENDISLFSSDFTRLDLHGDSIRSLDYDPVLQAYLLVSGSKKTRDAPFRLWLWAGKKVTAVTIKNINNLGYTEGITSIKTNSGEAALLLVNDDGKRGKLGAHYLITPYQSLQINQ